MKVVDSIDELVQYNKNARVVRIESFKLPEKVLDDGNFYYCGGGGDARNHIIGVPNKSNVIIDIDPVNNIVETWGYVKRETKEKGWTGCSLGPDGLFYCFPRGENRVLIVDTKNRTFTYSDIKQNYKSEHHYGGIMLNNGKIFQPPKGTDKVFVYDTKKNDSFEVPIKGISYSKARYYGASASLTDEVYFFPAGKYARVCKIGDDEIPRLIGKPIRDAFFNSGTLAQDQCIYGFSAYSKGIIKINTVTDEVGVLCKNLKGGYFGAKLGFNGKIYSVPGYSNEILEFDVETATISRKICLPDNEIGIKAKCAGGAIDSDGNIWMLPAMGSYVYKIVFDGLEAIPSEKLYSSKYFKSNY